MMLESGSDQPPLRSGDDHEDSLYRRMFRKPHFLMRGYSQGRDTEQQPYLIPSAARDRIQLPRRVSDAVEHK